MRALAMSIVLFATASAAAPPPAVSFQDGVAPTSAYSGTRDVRLSNKNIAHTPATNYSNDDHVSIWGGAIKQSALLHWDISAIPSTATVTAVTLALNISPGPVGSPSASTYELYEVLKPWVPTQASWDVSATDAPWGIAGAQQVGVDRAATPLGTVTGNALGTIMVSLNATGVATVQAWVSNSRPNNGFAIQNYTSTDLMAVMNEQASTTSRRPGLIITYRNPSMTTVTFRTGQLPTTSYAGTTSTTLANGPVSNLVNWNGEALEIDDTGAFLLSFDVSSVPAQADVTSATLELTVLEPSATQFSAYELLRPWTETGATWLTWDGVSPWAGMAASGVTDHRGPVLGGINCSVIGRTLVDFTDAGVATVQQWVRSAANNQGLLVYDLVNTDGADFADREWSVIAERPRLTVTYTLPGAGTIDAGPGAGNFDAGAADAAVADAGAPPDASVADAGGADAGNSDAGTADASVADASISADAGSADASVVDAGATADTGSPQSDAGQMDAGPQGPPRYTVGCDCQSGPSVAWVNFAFAVALMLRSFRRHKHSR